jgi:hypothetical protein
MIVFSCMLWLSEQFINRTSSVPFSSGNRSSTVIRSGKIKFVQFLLHFFFHALCPLSDQNMNLNTSLTIDKLFIASISLLSSTFVDCKLIMRLPCMEDRCEYIWLAGEKRWTFCLVGWRFLIIKVQHVVTCDVYTSDRLVLCKGGKKY